MGVKFVYVHSVENTLMNKENLEKHNKKENCENPEIIMPKPGSKIEFASAHLLIDSKYVALLAQHEINVMNTMVKVLAGIL